MAVGELRRIADFTGRDADLAKLYRQVAGNRW